MHIFVNPPLQRFSASNQAQLRRSATTTQKGKVQPQSAMPKTTLFTAQSPETPLHKLNKCQVHPGLLVSSLATHAARTNSVRSMAHACDAGSEAEITTAAHAAELPEMGSASNPLAMSAVGASKAGSRTGSAFSVPLQHVGVSAVYG
jgi:hypothetical protein